MENDQYLDRLVGIGETKDEAREQVLQKAKQLYSGLPEEHEMSERRTEQGYVVEMHYNAPVDAKPRPEAKKVPSAAPASPLENLCD